MNILITSVGRRGYLVNYFKEALSGNSHVHVANSVRTSAFRNADAAVVSPLISSSEYIDFLVEYCRKHDIQAILSLFDIDLQVLSNNKEYFASKGISILVSDPSVIKICNDKWLTMQFLDSLSIAHPSSWLSRDACKRALAAGEVAYPLVLKPRYGMGSIGLHEAENDRELDVLYDKILRTIKTTYVSIANFNGAREQVLIQEKVFGDEYGLDILNTLNGEYAATVAKKKLAMRSGETDVALTVENAPFLELAQKVSAGLGHIGNLDLDLVMTAQGKCSVLEMNARFGGGYPFSHLAGADFPRQLVKWLRGEGTDPTLLTYRSGLLMEKEIVPTVL